MGAGPQRGWPFRIVAGAPGVCGEAATGGEGVAGAKAKEEGEYASVAGAPWTMQGTVERVGVKHT